MTEVADNSVDLIVTSPPYNIGTKYGNNADKLDLTSYQNLLTKVFTECYRVLKDDGKVLIEAADSIFTDSVYMQLTGYIQSICIDLGFRLEERHINFAKTDKGIELPEHNWNQDYTTKADAHSNCHQIIVLSKLKSTVFRPTGKIMYFDYTSIKGHPCPTPKEIYSFVLDNYFKKSFVVLDVFMGTGILGKEVIKRGGIFMGYEIDESIFKIAKENLSNANSAA